MAKAHTVESQQNIECAELGYIQYGMICWVDAETHMIDDTNDIEGDESGLMKNGQSLSDFMKICEKPIIIM